jgi:ferrochelatase
VTQEHHDAVLVVSFGGPEKREDVIPFLENVLRGKPVPRERLLEVAEHYYHFDGISPINQHCRELIQELRTELDAHGINLPIYWGNRNWDPLLPAVVRQMKNDGIRHPLAYVTSGFSCYSGCRQYRENIQDALIQAEATEMQVGKIRVFYNHPNFIELLAIRLQEALDLLPSSTRSAAVIAFTAHSIPSGMANTSDYEKQLTESCRLVAEKLGLNETRWKLVYQSRSGRPQDPWLEPDINDHLRSLKSSGVPGVVIAPIGFLSDHMEVLYDLDDEATKTCQQLELPMQRAKTPGHHPLFVSMLRKLIQERLGTAPRECTGLFPPNHDVCPTDCCPAPQRPAVARPAP